MAFEGRAAFEADVEKFCARLELEARAVAWQSAERIRADAQRTLDAKTHGTGKTGRAIVRVEEREDQQFVVVSQGDAAAPANLPIWLEYGTVHMVARAYMRPAADRESSAYRAGMQRVLDRVMRDGIR